MGLWWKGKGVCWRVWERSGKGYGRVFVEREEQWWKGNWGEVGLGWEDEEKKPFFGDFVLSPSHWYLLFFGCWFYLLVFLFLPFFFSFKWINNYDYNFFFFLKKKTTIKTTYCWIYFIKIKQNGTIYKSN